MKGRSLLPSFWGRHALSERGRDDPFTSLHHEIDKLFADFGRGFRMPSMMMEATGMAPSIDVSETDSAIQVTAELPGVDEKDVEVNLTDGVLTIKGEKKSEKEDKGKDYHLVERAYGAFQRDIPLPYDIDTEKVDAKYAKGVLTVTLPKPPESKAKVKKIEVKGTA
ncbi:MAG: Hsp20/alpha crystallin family protein [Minwuiales bacterium]|nr:Hsp20/alpha crystallin family protein [Minwuiales bacterium]